MPSVTTYVVILLQDESICIAVSFIEHISISVNLVVMSARTVAGFFEPMKSSILIVQTCSMVSSMLLTLVSRHFFCSCGYLTNLWLYFNINTTNEMMVIDIAVVIDISCVGKWAYFRCSRWQFLHLSWSTVVDLMIASMLRMLSCHLVFQRV